MFLPGRMNNTWEYETGTDAGDPIIFNNIDIINNFEVKITKNGKWNTFYLVGCYFGNLYLLDEETFKYTRYSELEIKNPLF